MIKVLFKSMIHQKNIMVSFMIGVILITTIIPLSISTLKETMVKIEDDITKYARGSYDILLRPAGSRTLVETEIGIVEENYLSYGNGGISIEEWEKISKMGDIEVAAPVASLGYFTGETRSFATWMPTQSSRVSASFFTWDGMNEYVINEKKPNIGLLIEQEEIPQLVPPFIAFSGGNAWFDGEFPPSFLLPNTYHLLVGIDPKSEEQLTGITFASLSNELARFERDAYQFAEDAPIINVMHLTDPQVPVGTEIQWETLDISKEQTEEWKRELGLEKGDFFYSIGEEKLEQMHQMLLQYPHLEKNTFKKYFNDEIKPFHYKTFQLNKDFSINKDYDNYFGDRGNVTFYLTSPIQYIMKNNDLHVSKKGSQNGVPIYREMKKSGGTFAELGGELPFVFHPTGEYTIKEFEANLSSSPLGIYQLAPIKLIKDSNGTVVESPKELTSTIYPGSFVPSPAHGVITLQDAQLIKGDQPIDAIRVRIAGITEYNKAAKIKIEEVSTRFMENGYEVDIVAGSSYQEVPVMVEGVGTVIQPWTTLGAAASISENWSGTTFLLMILFSITAFIYLVNRNNFYLLMKNEEIALLHQFGWDTKKVKQLLLTELSILLVFSYIISTSILVFLLETNRQVILYNLLLTVLCYILIVFLTVLNTRDQTTEPIRTSNMIKNILKVKTLPFPLKSILYFQSLLVSTFIQFALVSTLSIFVYLSLQTTMEQTTTTYLGSHVYFQISHFHYLIILSVFIFAVISLVDSLSTLTVFRKDEVKLLSTIGWDDRKIVSIWSKEVAIWSGVAIIFGHIIGVVLFSLVFSFTIIHLFISFISGVSFFSFTIVFSIFYLRVLMNNRANRKVKYAESA